MVLVSCEANALGCFTAATPIGHLAFQCTPGLDRRHQCEPRLKLENVIARMRHNSSGISCSGNGEDDPGTRRNVDAQQLTWHTAAGHEKGAGEGGGRRAPLFGGKAEFIDESSQSSSTWRRGASDHLHPSRAALAPGRIAAAVSLVGGAESVRSVFKEGPVKRRHHQQQRQRDDAAVGAHAGRRVAEGLGRNGGRQNRSTMSAAVEVTGGGAASTSDKWNWRSRLSQSVYQQQQVGRQQIQRYGILPRGLGYTSIGRRTGGGGGHGTAMSMSSGTGSGDGSVEQPHPLGDTAGDGGSNGNGGLGGEAARAGDEQSTYFAIEREGEQAWPLEGTSPAAAARDRSSKARRRPTTAEKARQQGASAGRSAEIFSSLSLPFGSPQAETTATPASLEEGIKNRRSRGSDGDIWGPADAEIRLDAEEGGESAKADAGPIAESYERGRWLLGLLVLQSTSSSVLDKYQDLLREHVVITLFLTMLVGAGGNAGNQSAIKVIRGLATGRFTPDAACALRIVGGQAIVGLVLGTALAIGGFIRVWVTDGTSLRDASAISMSLFLIVMVSVLLGSALPFGFARAGVDPAHAGTTIQVAMDIVGVTVTCVTCSLVLTQLDQALSVPL